MSTDFTIFANIGTAARYRTATSGSTTQRSDQLSYSRKVRIPSGYSDSNRGTSRIRGGRSGQAELYPVTTLVRPAGLEPARLPTASSTLRVYRFATAAKNENHVFPSGGEDSNLRPLDPQSSALPGCATARRKNVNAETGFRRNCHDPEMVRRERLELSRPRGQRLLKPSCLPISPPSHVCWYGRKDSNLFIGIHNPALWPIELLPHIEMVRTESLELSCTKRWRLKPVCLPIPPRPRFLRPGPGSAIEGGRSRPVLCLVRRGRLELPRPMTPGFESGASADSAIAAKENWWAGRDSNPLRFYVTDLQSAAALAISAAYPLHALRIVPCRGRGRQGRSGRDSPGGLQDIHDFKELSGFRGTPGPQVRFERSKKKRTPATSVSGGPFPWFAKRGLSASITLASHHGPLTAPGIREWQQMQVGEGREGASHGCPENRASITHHVCAHRVHCLKSLPTERSADNRNMHGRSEGVKRPSNPFFEFYPSGGPPAAGTRLWFRSLVEVSISFVSRSHGTWPSPCRRQS